MYIPASSIVTLMVRGIKSSLPEGSKLLLEPGNIPLPGGLIVVPSLVSPVKPLFLVQVVNHSTEDVWFQPRTWLGTLCPVESLSPTEGCEVKFQRIAAGVEEITVNTEERQVLANTITDFPNKLQLGGTVGIFTFGILSYAFRSL